MNWQKSKESILILALVTICPEIINIFIYPLQFHHRAGFFLLGLGAIMSIWQQQKSEIDRITRVFEAKKIDVEGRFPRLLKGSE